MFRKKTGDYLDKCSILLHGYKLFAVLLLAFGMAACDDDTVPEPDPEPTSTFKLHIGEGNIVPMDLGAPDNYPPAYMAVLVMEDLPADEKIIYEGSVYSTENPEPDLSDCVFINDYSDYGAVPELGLGEGAAVLAVPVPPPSAARHDVLRAGLCADKQGGVLFQHG